VIRRLLVRLSGVHVTLPSGTGMVLCQLDDECRRIEGVAPSTRGAAFPESGQRALEAAGVERAKDRLLAALQPRPDDLPFDEILALVNAVQRYFRILLSPLYNRATADAERLSAALTYEVLPAMRALGLVDWEHAPETKP
jgi:hypothetical protein